MATYNLAASDLITLLQSTDQTQTGRAILESVVSAFSSAFPFSNTSVQQTNGPANTVPAGYASAASDTIGAGVQLELITLPTSTSITGSLFPTPAVGTETSASTISLTSLGGVVIGAGDQFVVVSDKNTGPTADTLIGGAGKEKLISAGGANVLVAGPGANSLLGGAGADTLIGGGASRLVAGTGANILKSSTLASGHDSLLGGAGADLLVSQAGNNRLVAGSGTNTLQGGSGNDTLISGGRTTFQVGSGATRILESVAGARDTIFAGSGNDTVVLSYGTANLGAVIVGGSSGTLRVAALAGSNTILGGSGTSDTVLLSTVATGNVTLSNASNQTIAAGAGGTIRVVTNEAYSNYSLATTPSGTNIVTFSDTHQVLTINDSSGTSVTLVFGSGHASVKI